MKRTTLFAALAAALSLVACAHGTDRQSLAGTGDETSRIPAAKGASGDTSSGSTHAQHGSQPCTSLTGAERELCLDRQPAAAGGSASSPDDSRRIPAAKGESQDTQDAPPRR